MAERRLLIVQPWLGAFGHPAQSLLTLARALGPRPDVEYLVSLNPGSELCEQSCRSLRQYGPVHVFGVDTLAADGNTVKACAALVKLRLGGVRFRHVFFFDASLPAIARYWPLIRWLGPAQRLGVLHMHGPELVSKNAKALQRVSRLLADPAVSLYLRTDELTQSWVELLGQAVPGAQIRTLPSLEIPDDPALQSEAADANRINGEFDGGPDDNFGGKLAFGIIGQIRVGKGIEWLVPAFVQQPQLGRLTVAGEFNTAETQRQLALLQGYPGFIRSFMSEAEMLVLSRQQDYLLMLYEPWDGRMESAVLYLAARVGKPVVVYGDSWCGRMVREFGCGVVVPFEHARALAALAALPRPGSSAYAELIAGVRRFRDAHSLAALKPTIVHELLG